MHLFNSISRKLQQIQMLEVHEVWQQLSLAMFLLHNPQINQSRFRLPSAWLILYHKFLPSLLATPPTCSRLLWSSPSKSQSNQNRHLKPFLQTISPSIQACTLPNQNKRIKKSKVYLHDHLASLLEFEASLVQIYDSLILKSIACLLALSQHLYSFPF